ncbi:hypothetical protein [Paraliobacillus ryukyuensis]|uniref:hypothetical protein n=1 Tax=Paraliobacillus ryukyuensis TaxID=200904 RepID=UPI0009A82D12|nr:hypothetical protein [Paraliobacillus ryukyuensis]
MKNDKNNVKLGYVEYRDLTIQTGLQFLPVFGPAISTAYYGYKQEKRFKRIESFYSDLASKLEKLESDIEFKDIDKENEDDIISMVEQLNDEIEKQSQQNKKEFYENYFINYMKKNNDDYRYNYQLFFEMLKNISETTLWTLKDFYKDVPKSAIVLSNDSSRARIYTLINYGLLELEDETTVRNEPIFYPKTQNDRINITKLGRDFHHFCLYCD